MMAQLENSGKVILDGLYTVLTSIVGQQGPQEVAVVQNQWDRSHFGVGEFTTHFRTYSSGDWDVHWGLTGVLTHGQVMLKSTQHGIRVSPCVGLVKGDFRVPQGHPRT